MIQQGIISMRNIWRDALLAATFALGASGAAQAADSQATLVAQDATLTKVAGDFQFVEGPAPDADGNIYFSDITAEKTFKWSAADGRITLHREQTGKANGLMFDREGRLVVCEMGNNRVVRDDLKGSVTTLVDSSPDMPINMPNDLWIDARGGIYFSNFAGGMGPGADSAEKLQIYYLHPDGKQLTRATNDLTSPNGLIGTPDGKLMYAADRDVTWVYRIGTDGELSGRKQFAAQNTDGMALDEHGNVYLSGSPINVYSADGRKLMEIAVPERAANLKFGGQDGRTLFITAGKSVYTLQMQVRGAASALQLARNQNRK